MPGDIHKPLSIGSSWQKATLILASCGCSAMGESANSNAVNAFWDWDELPGAPGRFTQSHRSFQATCRAFIESEVMPNVDQWEEDCGFPRSLHETAYKAGMYGAFWPKKYGGTTPTEEEMDMFHYFIFWQEIRLRSLFVLETLHFW